MENQNESAGSETGTNEEIIENDELTALKEESDKLKNTNKQLFERAKKAEAEAKELKEFKEKAEAKTEKLVDKSGKLDLGQKAFLRTHGIKEDDYEFVEQQIKSSGMQVDDLVTNPYFLSKLQEKRNYETVLDATPEGSKRSTTVSRNQAEYWLKKGEMPSNTPGNRKLRQDIVNSRMEQEKSASKFAEVGVIGG